jgi:hypothetical protein
MREVDTASCLRAGVISGHDPRRLASHRAPNGRSCGGGTCTCGCGESQDSKMELMASCDFLTPLSEVLTIFGVSWSSSPHHLLQCSSARVHHYKVPSLTVKVSLRIDVLLLLNQYLDLASVDEENQKSRSASQSHHCAIGVALSSFHVPTLGSPSRNRRPRGTQSGGGHTASAGHAALRLLASASDGVVGMYSPVGQRWGCWRAPSGQVHPC